MAKLTVWIVNNRQGRPVRPIDDVYQMLKEVNDLYAQVGMTFYLDSMTITNCPVAYDAHRHLPSTNGNLNFRQIANFSSATGGLECYFINSFVDAEDVVGLNCDSGLLLTKSATAVDWAHEIGHACGLNDIYWEKGDGLIPDSRKFVCSDAPGDWNDGSAPGHASARYYAADTKLVGIIERLLMYGHGGSAADWRHVDISTGVVRGLNVFGCLDSVETGILGVSSATRSPTHD